MFYFWWKWAASPVCSVNCLGKTFIINKNEGISSVANELAKENLIHNSLAFKIYSVINKTNNRIQAGEFKLNPQMSMAEISRQLTHGTADLWVTIIEGWRKEEVAAKLAESGLANYNIQEFLEKTKNLEGKIFPDTYLIPKTASIDKIIEMISKNYQKKAGTVDNKTLILASIIEREVPRPEDRPIIAGILLKRLKTDWLLQVDATVQYAIATQQLNNGAMKQSSNFNWWPKNLSKADLAIKSSFNTYLNLGFPPTPICNPGLDAIKAAQNPAQTDYWYYLSDNSGLTHFAKTIEEHNQNVAKYLGK